MRAGSKLKAAREAKGLTLEQVSAQLRVREDFIAALESMNINLLPGKAYAKAYLRSYVKLLGLPEEEIVQQYERESALLREDNDEQIRNPDSKPAPERPWIWAVVLAVVCAGFIGWRALEHKPQSDPADTNTAATVQAQATPSASSGREVVDDSADDPWGLASQVVEIEASQDAWLEVRGPDGTIFLSKTMRKGERYRPDVGAGWTLHAADGGAFQVYLNKQLIGPLGQAQSPVLGRSVDVIAKAALGEG